MGSIPIHFRRGCSLGGQAARGVEKAHTGGCRVTVGCESSGSHGAQIEGLRQSLERGLAPGVRYGQGRDHGEWARKTVAAPGSVGVAVPGISSRAERPIAAPGRPVARGSRVVPGLDAESARASADRAVEFLPAARHRTRRASPGMGGGGAAVRRCPAEPGGGDRVPGPGAGDSCRQFCEQHAGMDLVVWTRWPGGAGLSSRTQPRAQLPIRGRPGLENRVPAAVGSVLGPGIDDG